MCQQVALLSHLDLDGLAHLNFAELDIFDSLGLALQYFARHAHLEFEKRVG